MNTSKLAAETADEIVGELLWNPKRQMFRAEGRDRDGDLLFEGPWRKDSEDAKHAAVMLLGAFAGALYAAGERARSGRQDRVTASNRL